MRHRGLVFLMVASALVTNVGFAQRPQLAPPVDLPNTPLSSPNVHLVGTIPGTSSVGGRFMSHYFFTTSENAGLIPIQGLPGLQIYDVKDPENPILAGWLPLPHTENEDVEVSNKRNLVLISQDVTSSRVPIGGALYVIDVAKPLVPMLRGVLQYPASAATVKDPSSPTGTSARGGPGHIANCILGCMYAYITGARDGSVYVVDLRDVTKPHIIGKIFSPAGKPNVTFTTGIVHNVDVDGYGNVWFTGSGGTAMYAPITNPLRPRLLAAISPRDNAKYDQFIHHNSLRLDRGTVLVTEEDWEEPQCGAGTPKPVRDAAGMHDQGSFQAWKIGRGTITPLGTWQTELGNYLDGGAAVTIVCSSHWFSFNQHKVVAVGWYNQGVRFLDVSNPRRIRQVGYFMGPFTTASAGLFVPGRPDLVYVPDYDRGIDILKIDKGGAGAATVHAPVRAEWFTDYKGVTFRPSFQPDPAFGWSCARPSF